MARSILRFHDRGDSAARWLRDIDLRNPIKGSNRTKAPLFADAQDAPFRDQTFAALIMEALKATMGESRAKLLSPLVACVAGIVAAHVQRERRAHTGEGPMAQPGQRVHLLDGDATMVRRNLQDQQNRSGGRRGQATHLVRALRRHRLVGEVHAETAQLLALPRRRAVDPGGDK
jgi:hypothetical protein